MPAIIEIETKRLKLRQWKVEDRPSFASINADPDVMRYFPRMLSAKESDYMVQRHQRLIAERGWGFWALEMIKERKFIGFVGLNSPDYDLPFTPCVEIGWRLAREHWGQGYATEAAKASLGIAFDKLNLSEVYSFTPVSNTKSLAVMERLGMNNTNKNFNHPKIPGNSPLREHVLYKIDRKAWTIEEPRKD